MFTKLLVNTRETTSGPFKTSFNQLLYQLNITVDDVNRHFDLINLTVELVLEYMKYNTGWNTYSSITL